MKTVQVKMMRKAFLYQLMMFRRNLEITLMKELIMELALAMDLKMELEKVLEKDLKMQEEMKVEVDLEVDLEMDLEMDLEVNLEVDLEMDLEMDLEVDLEVNLEVDLEVNLEEAKEEMDKAKLEVSAVKTAILPQVNRLLRSMKCVSGIISMTTLMLQDNSFNLMMKAQWLTSFSKATVLSVTT